MYIANCKQYKLTLPAYEWRILSLEQILWTKFTRSKFGNWPLRPSNFTSIFFIFMEDNSKFIAACIAPPLAGNSPASRTPGWETKWLDNIIQQNIKFFII